MIGLKFPLRRFATSAPHPFDFKCAHISALPTPSPFCHARRHIIVQSLRSKIAILNQLLILLLLSSEKDGGRKYIQRIVGAAAITSHATVDDGHGDGSSSRSSSGSARGVIGDDFGDDDRAFSLWARDIDKMKVES